MKEEMDGEVSISRQNLHFSFIDLMIKVPFPTCTLNWRVSNYVSRQRRGLNRRNENTKTKDKLVAFGIVLSF